MSRTELLSGLRTIRYTRLGPSRAISESHSIHIADVENAGTPKQHEDPPDRGHGYLWRLNDYGRYRQDQAGVYVQFEMIGLTRGIPFGFGWLIKPVVRNLPANSLMLSLSRTRKAVEAQMSQRESAMTPHNIGTA